MVARSAEFEEAAPRRASRSLGSTVLKVVGLVAFSLLAAIVIYPIFFAFNSAFKGATDFKEHRLSLAIPPNFDALRQVWSIIDVPHAVANSLIISVSAVVGVWFTGSLAAYAYTKLRPRFGGVLFAIVLGSLMVPVQVVLTPLFLVMRDVHLLNTRAGLILALITFQLPVAVFMFASYFRRLPGEVSEAAAVDGASHIRTWWHVVLPMSLPALATVGTISFVWSWNELLLPIIILQSDDLQPLTVRAAQMQGNFTPEPVLEAAGVAYALIPMLIAFLIAQRFLVGAATTGAIKE
jgi:ABC-type glycerol-3-phosphate transport system permease component